jgi:hypothetical protein
VSRLLDNPLVEFVLVVLALGLIVVLAVQLTSDPAEPCDLDVTLTSRQIELVVHDGHVLLHDVQCEER